jgi:hypothetical protein
MNSALLHMLLVCFARLNMFLMLTLDRHIDEQLYPPWQVAAGDPAARKPTLTAARLNRAIKNP